MHIKRIHSWAKNYEKAVQIQKELSESLVIKKDHGKIHTVAGADVSYDKHSDLVFAAVIVFRINKNLEKIEETTAIEKARFPYIPGLLSFREAPVLLKSFKKLIMEPDVILFDGQGIAHPRSFGLASHVGLILDKPSIGCAKSRLVGDYSDVENSVGAYSSLIYKDKIVGVVLRTKLNTNPIFVSVGHKTSLSFATRFVLKTCRGYRVPEPIRQAHLLVNKLRKENIL
ncbi:MAG: deoxyribonuclease V [Candidatus Kuenenia sp.]|nr:deoxyribonuclease V [Candidatus Kuenenia hertensis]